MDWSADIEAVINVREFLQQWDESAKSMCLTVKGAKEKGEKDSLAQRMNLSHETVDELTNVCSIETLWCGDEPMDRKILLAQVPDNTGLNTLDYQKIEIKKTHPDGQSGSRKYKYRHIDSHMLPTLTSETQNFSFVPEEYQVPIVDVILVVSIHKLVGTNVYCRLLKDQTYLVRGQSCLTELRDKITCANDYAVAGDMSHCPNADAETCAKDIYKSGFFFIEGVFYNDMRESDNLDYSEEVRAWVKQRGGPNLVTADMASTQFLDLNIQLGSAYLYLHQGDCEHILVFNDIRLLHPTDPQDVQQYPYLLRKSLCKRIVCRACSTQTARWQVVNSRLAPESPCYMCHDCFMSFHYDTNDKKLGNFKAYKYVDSALL